MKLRPGVLNREISAAALFQSWLGILEADIILGERLRNCHQASFPHSPASLFLSPPLTRLSSTQRRCSLHGVTPRLIRRPTNLLLSALQCGQPLLNPPRPSQDQAAVSDRTIQVLYRPRGTSKGESAALRARARPLLVGSLTASQARSRPISGSGHQFTEFQPAYSQKENIRVCLRK